MQTDGQLLKVAVITGGSDGIGKALCFEYGSKGYAVVFTGRDQEKLAGVSGQLSAQGIQNQYFALDAASRDDNQQLVQRTLELFGRIDVLICNAGVSQRSLFQDISLDTFEKLVHINFLGPVSLVQYALPALEKSQGHIIGVSSINGRRATPARTAYASSKYALEGFLESLRMELRPKGIKVLAVCPGFTQTNMRSSAIMPDGKEQGKSLQDETKHMTPEEVARRVYKAMKRERRDLILTSQGKLAIWVGKFFPSFVDRMVFKVMARKPDSPFYGR